ncbi:bacteriohemerythrin [Sedimenticola sp.]|uniref:bacteriohemerythrin n=1 Tax=Sedimenticola sp. TaxID=1940285 RepID=UPI003D121F9A
MRNLFDWNESWNIGVGWMDDAHLQLAHGLAGLFQQYTDEGASLSPERMADYCDCLLEQAKVHFRDEEEWMEFLNYPGFLSHVREHSMLLAELKYYIKEIKSGGNGISLEVLMALKGWLVTHVTESDREFVDFLKKHGLFDSRHMEGRQSLSEESTFAEVS